MFIIPLIFFLIAPQFVYAQQTDNKEISVYNSDFSSGTKGWSSFGREKDALTFTAENSEAHVVYTGTRDWAISNSTRIPVSAGQAFQITCSGKCDLSIPSGRLCVVCMKDNKVTDYHLAQTEYFTGDWKTYSAVFSIYDGIDTIYLRLNGEGQTNAYAKNISLVKIPSTSITPSTIRNEEVFENGKFSSKKVLALYPSAESSYGLQSQGEKLDRGLSLTPVSQTSVMISWRLLKSDPADITFTVSRTRYGTTRIITKKPLSNATNFIYNDAAIGDIYTVSSNYDRSLATYTLSTPYTSIPLADKDGAEKIAVADLNGDGKYDFVAKCPGGNIDPGYYTPSKKTYSLQAYTSEGVLLWKKDLGWNIESGTWYSPYVAADLNGDGKAEIIVKTGDDTANGKKDWRDNDGRVRTGPEYLSVLDGMTGKELARTDWISRDGFEDYNRTSRNQLAIAYFDSPDEKTGSRKIPCIIMLRGTYGLMKAEALMYIPSEKTDSQSSQSLSAPNGQLIPVWSYSNKFLPPNTRGQGAHYTICTDIDNDGRDEVILGSIVLDDDGSILWTTGRGHPDGVYFGDINPAHDGNEIAYFYETKQNSGGILLADALTGKELWTLPYQTDHIHSRAMCADIDATHPGRELYGQDCINHVYNGKRWLLASDGTVLKDAAQLDREHNKWGFAPAVAYWNGTNQKSIVDNKLLSNFSGTIVMIADITGDWREEVVTATKTELRIYTTTIPVSIRRPCLMQEPEYRSTVTMDSNAYLQYPDTIGPVLSK